MNTRQLALTSVLSALTVALSYSRGLAAPSLPGVFEFMTVSIFIAGFCFGTRVGGVVGVVSLTVYILSFTHWLTRLLGSTQPVRFFWR